MKIIQFPSLLYPAYVQDYLDRVTAADVAAGNISGLERGVTDAISSFLQDLVSIPYLGVSGNVISQAASTIKAMPILAGARTLAGASIPVVGPAPTIFNSTSANYNRKTGVLGNASTIYINSNRSNSAEPRDNRHLAVHVTSASSVGSFLASQNSFNVSGDTFIYQDSGALQYRAFLRSSSSASVSFNALAPAIGIVGVGRNNNSTLTYRLNGSTVSVSNSSATPLNENTRILGTGNFLSNARIATYSIGEFLDFAILESRINLLLTSLASAIP